MENSTSPPFKNSLPLDASPLCPQLVKQPSKVGPGAGSEALPFLGAASLVLEHKLNKIRLDISLGFPLDFYLGEPKNLNAGNTFFASALFCKSIPGS